MDTSHLPARTARLQALLAARGLDALLVLKPQSTFYCSGFTPGIYSHPIAVLVPVEGDPALVVWANRGPSARETSPVRDIVTYGRWSRDVGLPDWAAAVRSALADRGLLAARVGVETDHLPAAHLERLRRETPDASFVDLGGLVDEARSVKDAGEIAALRDACAVTDVGVAAAQEAAAARGSEIDISIAAMRAMQDEWRANYPHREAFGFGHSEGGVYHSLWTYALTGERVRKNCAQPTARRVRDGEIVWTVVVAALDGQHAENERSFAVGELDEQRRSAYEALLRIHTGGLELLRPGARLGDVHAGLLDLYRANGYGDFTPGRIGHGVGLGAHEFPGMGPDDDTVLVPGMTITYEPNLRVPAFGGLQHSDTVLVTEDGVEFLTTHRRDYIQV